MTMKAGAPMILGKFDRKEESDPDDLLRLNLPALVGGHAFLLASSGGGKSGLIRKLLETTHGAVQQIVLDAEDEFYTLRERYHDYILAGGDEGDIPISTATAGDLALAILEHGFSVVIQLNDMEDRAEFIGAFLTALVAAPRQFWHPVLVVLDEAQRFIPQGEVTPATSGIKSLVQRGRKRGFTAVLASLRFAEVSKSVTSELRTKFLGRVGEEVDTKRVSAILGFPARSAEARELHRLDERMFWTFGPGTVRHPRLFRVGDVETRTIKAGQVHPPATPPPAALKRILASLAKATATVPATSAVDGATPRHVQPGEIDRLAKLEAENAALRQRAVRAEQGEAIAVQRRQQVTAILDAACVDLKGVREVLGRIEGSMEAPLLDSSQVAVAKKAIPQGKHGAVDFSTVPLTAPAAVPATTAPAPTNVEPGVPFTHATDLPDGQAKVLTAVVQTQGGAARDQVMVLSEYSRSTCNAYIQRLRRQGLVEESGDRITATPEGIAKLGKSFEPLPVGAALRKKWLAELPDGESKLLAVAFAKYPGSLSRTEFDACGYSVSTRNAYLSRLRRSRLVKTVGKEIVASQYFY